MKLDGCYSHPNDMDKGYPEFGYWLNQTGRPMIYACSWPVYQTYSGMTPNYTSIINTCNLWRNFDDIQVKLSTKFCVLRYLEKPGAYSLLNAFEHGESTLSTLSTDY